MTVSDDAASDGDSDDGGDAVGAPEVPQVESADTDAEGTIRLVDDSETAATAIVDASAEPAADAPAASGIAATLQKALGDRQTLLGAVDHVQLRAALGAPESAAPSNLDVVLDIPIRLSMEIGATSVSIRKLLQLNRGSVLELDQVAGEPLEIFANGTLVAHGEVVVVNEKYGIKLLDVVSPRERIERLN